MVKPQKINYKKLNTELDKIIEALQADDLDIDEVLSAYQRGAEIIEQLQTYLKQAQNKVSKIKSNWDK